MTQAPSKQLIPDDLSVLELTPPTWTWRNAQRDLAEQIANSPKKIVMLEAECGSGKSIIPTAAALATSRRAIVLTQTIQLQQQYLKDLEGLALMNGRANSECNLTFQPATDAPCSVGVQCHLKGTWRQGIPQDIPVCNYYKKKAAAALSQLSIQNYAYWLNETEVGDNSTFGKPDWIICDEGHDLDQILMNAGVIEIRLGDMRELGVQIFSEISSMTMVELREWARGALTKANAAYFKKIGDEAAKLGIPRDERGNLMVTAETWNSKGRPLQLLTKALQTYQRCKEIQDDLRGLSDAELEEWRICAPDNNNREWTVRPLYGKYAFRRILNAAKEKVVIMSAFLAPPLLMKNLGLKPEDVDVIIAPKVYNRVRSPIVYCPTVRVNYNITQRQQRFLYATMDAIMAHFNDKKGLIHVPSVKMRDEIMLYTRLKDRIICYDGTNVRNRKYQTKDEAIEEFVASKEPKVLLGQSISTGLDLPGVPEWQIIMKLSFPPTTDPVIAARKEVDPFFYDYHTICQLVQSAGRVKRSQEHNGITIILDESFRFFWAKNRKHFPQWFHDSFRYDGWKYLPDVYKMLPRIGSAIGYQWSPR